MQLIKLVFGLALVLSSGPAFAACEEPKTGTDNVPIFSPPLSEVVVGQGRLQFYSAPKAGCEMKGVFIIPKDDVVAYAQSDDGWTSVMYTNPKDRRKDVEGWVKSNRLKKTGTAGPTQ